MKNCRVAFFVYPSAFQSPGGGEVQLLKTREYLEKEGLKIKLFDTWTDKLKDFDILHTFGSVKDCLPMMETARTLGVRNVLSTICWYGWKAAWHTYPALKDRSVSVLRHLAKSWLPFFPSKRRKMMEVSDLLYPNSQTEADQLVRYFGVSKEKIVIIPNGVDAYFSEAKPDMFIAKYGLKDFILCVGRIEPRKNQLNMVRALKGLNIPVVFIGENVHQYRNYLEACRKEADGNIHFLGALPHSDGMLASAYAACNTFLLASWLETPGLAALEASLTGAKIVITDQGATREYFQAFASYVAPDNLGQIRQAVLAAIKKPKNVKLQTYVLNHYSWQQVAQKTREGYERLMAHG